MSLAEKLPVELRDYLSPSDPFQLYCEYVLDESIDDDDAAAKYDELVWTMDTSPSIASSRTTGTACIASMPMSGESALDDPALDGAFADLFFDSVGRVDPSELAPAFGGTFVNIFLVDNWAGNGGSDVAQDDHGENLARILEHLIEGTDGDIRVEPIVGLPRMDGDLSEVYPGGGVKGTAPDLGVAFMTAAAAHVRDSMFGPTRSIVNASVGSPALDSVNLDSDATQALIEATKTLACLGVQVNFAAGNELPHETVCGIDPDGLLFPGDLDGTFPAQTKAECIGRGYAPTEPDSFYAYGTWQPTAVSGVDAAGNPLPNGRLDGSHTGIVATGVAARTAADASFMLTGASVSTAVMSAASALKWWLAPELGPEDVTDAVASSGDILPMTADAGSYLGSTVQMIDICSTIAADLGDQGITATCPEVGMNPYDPFGVMFQDLAMKADVEGLLTSAEASFEGNQPLCNAPQNFNLTDALVNPAPTRPACDNCTAGTNILGQTGHNTAYLGMSELPWAQNLTITGAYLIVRDIEYAGAIFFLGEAVIQDMNNSGTGKMIEVDFEFDDLVSAKLHLNYSDGETMTVTTLPVWSGGT